MELSRLNDVCDLDSATCKIDDPTTGDYAFSLVIAGPMHASTRAHAESEGRSLAHQGKRLGSMQKAMDARAETILTDSDVAIAKQVKNLMARTLDWKDVTQDGKPIPYDAKQMQEWYEKHTWLRDAVILFIGDSLNFLNVSSTNSSSTPSTNSN